MKKWRTFSLERALDIPLFLSEFALVFFYPLFGALFSSLGSRHFFLMAVLLATFPLMALFSLRSFSLKAKERKLSFVVGALGCGFGSLLCGFGVLTNQIVYLFLGRAITGWCGGPFALAHLLPKESKIVPLLSKHALYLPTISLVIALIFGSFLSDSSITTRFNLALPFWGSALLFAIFSLILAYRATSSLNVELPPPVDNPSFSLTFLRDHKLSFASYFFLELAWFTALITYGPVIPFSIWFLSIALAFAIGYFLLFPTFHRTLPAKLGFLFSLSGLSLFAFLSFVTSEPYLSFFFLILFALYAGLSDALFSSYFNRPHLQHFIFALGKMRMKYLAAFIGPLLAALFFPTYLPLLITLAAFSALISTLFTDLKR